jgi:hypothetical protein
VRPPGPGNAFLYSGGNFTTIAVADSGNFDSGADSGNFVGSYYYNDARIFYPSMGT